MSIGPSARKWFLTNYGKGKVKVYSSKYYLPEESWPKKHVWWIQIPPCSIDPALYQYVNMLCQVKPSEKNFHYLKVPVTFILEHQKKFHRIGDMIDFYFSAEETTLFKELRGTTELDFSSFVVLLDK